MDSRPNGSNNLQNPLFSIAVVTFDQAHLLNQCLDSVFRQNYDNIELIVCDDHSCDFDCMAVRQYIEKNKGKNIKNIIVYQQAQNVGISMNCQKALELSSGDFIKFQAGDDMLADEQAISYIVQKFLECGKGVIFSRARAQTYEGVPTQNIYPYNSYFSTAEAMDISQLLTAVSTKTWGAYICAPAAFFRTAFLRSMGGFNPDYKYMEDWPFWIKMLQAGYEPCFYNVITVLYRYGGISNRQTELVWKLSQNHYEECTRMLQNEALPYLAQHGTKEAQQRCQQCIRAISCRETAELYWKYYNFFDKVKWRVDNSDFFIRAFWDRKAFFNLDFKPLKKAMVICAASVILFAIREKSVLPQFATVLCCTAYLCGFLMGTVNIFRNGGIIISKVVKKIEDSR